MKKFQLLQFSRGNTGEVRSCCTLLYIPFSSPWLLVALKRLGWKWSRYQSSLSPCWGRVVSSLGFRLFAPPFHPFVFPVVAPVPWLLMHFPFRGWPCALICMMNFTPTFIICRAEHPSLKLAPPAGKCHTVDGSRARRPPPSMAVINPATAERAPNSYMVTHLMLIIILSHQSCCPRVVCWACLSSHTLTCSYDAVHTILHNHPIFARDAGYHCW